MTTAERIGTLPPFSHVLDWPMWAVIVFAAVATPLSIIPIVGLWEARDIPLGPRVQFLAFMPGDIFLSTFFVWCVYLAKNHMPDGVHWYNQDWHGTRLFHVITLLVFILVCVILTYLDWKSGLYTKGQLLSPWKIYHNLLYAWYGYLVASVGIPVLFHANVGWAKLIPVAIVGVWIVCLVADASLSPDAAKRKARSAHVDYSWRTGQSSYVP